MSRRIFKFFEKFFRSIFAQKIAHQPSNAKHGKQLGFKAVSEAV